MKSHETLFLTILLPLILFTNCQDSHQNQTESLSKIDLSRGDIILCSGEEFGEVTFSVSCKTSVKKTFDLAISLLHSFEYDEAEKAFVKVIDIDPDCAMAYWGVAMSIYHALWAPPGQEDLIKGAKVLEAAASIDKTEREQAYLDAIGLYYTDWQSTSAKTRASRMADKMEEIYQKYDDDAEAAILYALALNSTADPTDKNYTNQRKAGQILEALLPDHPNHPGIAHYIIHNYDNPALAEKALSTARTYAKIAPASAHAQHMPSHIFTRLGLWDESIRSNLNSTSAALCYAEQANFNAHWDEELHGMDYLAYAYLQQGDNQHASEQNSYLQTMEKVFPVNFKDAYALAAIPARMVLENKQWHQAAELQFPPIHFPWNDFPWQKSILHFTRSLGAVHIGNLDQAENEITILKSLQNALEASEQAYQANQVKIQLNTAEAWLLFARGDHENAISKMKLSADMEDNTTKHPVTPCEVIPARELLADLLAAAGHNAEALHAYEMDLQTHPGRFNGLYGAALSASKLGNKQKATVYFKELVNQVGSIESDRSEIQDAKSYLTKI